MRNIKLTVEGVKWLVFFVIVIMILDANRNPASASENQQNINVKTIDKIKEKLNLVA